MADTSTAVTITYKLAAARAKRLPATGGAAVYDLPTCAYCGKPALASSHAELRTTLTSPDARDVPVELITHRCQEHMHAGAHAIATKKADLAAGTSGLVIGAILYLLINMTGASNGWAFFQPGNIVWVILVGLIFVAASAIVSEVISRRLHRRGRALPQAVTMQPEDDRVIYRFTRPELADALLELLAEETIIIE
ncbi:MAG: hypothetical protein GXY52_11815 [Chloroflexi bacterium]|nr:hypothetical protein [Chloroflexota bacterium]